MVENDLIARERILLVLLVNYSELVSALVEFVLVDVPECVNEVAVQVAEYLVFLALVRAVRDIVCDDALLVHWDADTAGLREFGHLEGAQSDDGGTVLGHLIGLFLGNSRCPCFLERCADGENRPLAVAGEACRSSSRHPEFLSRLNFDNHQFPVSLLRHYAVGEVFAVVCNGCAADALPAVIHIVVQGLFLGWKLQCAEYQQYCYYYCPSHRLSSK